MFEPSAVSLVIFILAYALFVFFSSRRTVIALAGAGLLILLRAVSPEQAFWAVNWNVMGIFVGTLCVADIFMESRVPAFLAEVIVDKARSTTWAILFICFLTGCFSMLLENVATVLLVAPVALSLAEKLKISPVPMMIAIAITSNLQGGATLIGDPPSMLLGGFAKMNFLDFFFYQGRPSIFFAVQLGAVASSFVLYAMFRRHKEKVRNLRIEKVKSWVPTGILGALVVLLAISSFYDVNFSYMSGVICMAAGVIALGWGKFVNKSPIIKGIRSLDWDTTFFLIGIFVLVGGVTANGWIEVMAACFSRFIGENILLGYILLVLISVFLSAFVDNVPFLAAMLPVGVLMAERLQIPPSLFLFGLLIGASVGGNITPIGASANIVACGMLKKEGYEVKFGDFVKIGLPFTLAAVGAASLFIWFVWR